MIRFFQKIDAQIRAQIEEAVRRATTDEEIGIEELSADLYAAPIELTVRNIHPSLPLLHKSVGNAINLN